MIKAIQKSTLSILKIAKIQFSNLNKRPNLYTLLQIKEDASQEEIRYNYYKLMSQYQPEGVAPNEGLKHSRLLNQAYAILSNQKLRKKYDHQNGFNLNKSSNKKPQKIQMTFHEQADLHLHEAKKGFSTIIGDKQTRLRQKLLAISAIGMFVVTCVLVFTGKGYKKQVLSRSQSNNKS